MHIVIGFAIRYTNKRQRYKRRYEVSEMRYFQRVVCGVLIFLTANCAARELCGLRFVCAAISG